MVFMYALMEHKWVVNIRLWGVIKGVCNIIIPLWDVIIGVWGVIMIV